MITATMASKRPRAFFLQHAVYPYRREVFDVLAERFELDVCFCIRAKTFRRWSTDAMFERARFGARVLPALRWGPLALNPTMAWHFLRHRYDVVIVGGVDLLSLLQVVQLLVLARVTGARVVMCEEYFITTYESRIHPVKTRVARRVRRLVYARCDRFVAWSRKARADLVKIGVPPAQIFTGPQRYPRSPLLDAPANLEGQSRFTVLAISYLLPRKGLAHLVRAFKRLPNEARLIIGGSGPDERQLTDVVAGDPRIELVGYVDEAEKDRLLREASVLVLPSLHDVWGLVVNEAMYYGMPVIVSDAVGCGDDLVSGNGFVVPAGDEDKLYEKMAYLLDHPAERAAMGLRSRELIEPVTAAAQAEPVIRAVCSALEFAPGRTEPGARSDGQPDLHRHGVQGGRTISRMVDAVYEGATELLPPTLAASVDLLRPSLASSWGGPLNGQVRRVEIVRDIGQSISFDRAIETGTYRGTTTEFLHRVLACPTETVEKSRRFFIYSRHRLARHSGIRVASGDSRIFLRVLGHHSGGETVFVYLDAHWGADLPFVDEMRIVASCWTRAVVMIDDFEVPDDPGYGYDDYGPGKVLNELYLPTEALEGWHLFYPSAPSAAETGARRGCAILSSPSLGAILGGVSTLRRARVL